MKKIAAFFGNVHVLGHSGLYSMFIQSSKEDCSMITSILGFAVLVIVFVVTEAVAVIPVFAVMPGILIVAGIIRLFNKNRLMQAELHRRYIS